MTSLDYWKEGLAGAAQECSLVITDAQLNSLAKAVENGHENYGQAFYSPPGSDRLNEIERDWRNKYKRLEQEFERYRTNAETAVKQALRQSDDAVVSIGEHGEVKRYGGRTETIQ